MSHDDALPKCSVVIPVKNNEAYIGQQLEGLANQTYRGWWEVIVADNGSTDGSAEVARRWADRVPNLRVVDASERPGPAFARNLGTRLAQGELIAYCDGDDVVDHKWLEALAEVSLTHDIVAGRRDDSTLNPPSARPLVDTFTEPRPDLPEFGFLPWTEGGNMAVSRAAFDAIDGWKEYYGMCEDMDFCWRLQLAGYKWGYAPDAVVHYRQRATLRGFIKQRYSWARYEPLYYKEFRAHGYQRESHRVVLRDWLWIVTRVPFLVMDGPRRRHWLHKLVNRVGRLVGSVEHRTWCP